MYHLLYFLQNQNWAATWQNQQKGCAPSEDSDQTGRILAKTQISLGIRPVWSESSLGAQWVAMGPSFHHADNEDSDQTGRTVMLLVLSCRKRTLDGLFLKSKCVCEHIGYK